MILLRNNIKQFILSIEKTLEDFLQINFIFKLLNYLYKIGYLHYIIPLNFLPPKFLSHYFRDLKNVYSNLSLK